MRRATEWATRNAGIATVSNELVRPCAAVMGRVSCEKIVIEPLAQRVDTVMHAVAWCDRPRHRRRDADSHGAAATTVGDTRSGVMRQSTSDELSGRSCGLVFLNNTETVLAQRTGRVRSLSPVHPPPPADPCRRWYEPFFDGPRPPCRGRGRRVVACRRAGRPDRVRRDAAVALTTGNQLVTFDTDTPGTASSPVAVTGLQSGESLVGIDFRPNGGQLYGLGNSAQLYTIDPTTAPRHRGQTRLGRAAERPGVLRVRLQPGRTRSRIVVVGEDQSERRG